jgi:hypothetical protein
VTVDSSIFCFATDLADEGVETVLGNVQERGGLGGVTVAASYHEGRDLFPHNPVRRIRFLESGAVFFRPRALRGVRLTPPVSETIGALPEAIHAAGRRGMQVRAWAVFLHNGALAEAHPNCAPENAFGDRYVTDLCPAHPDVRAFARALAEDVAGLGVERICAESLHYHGLEHGYAHERYFLPLGPRVRYLLGLCFCEHCLAAARSRGVDGDAARRRARDEIERAFAGDADDTGEPERDEYAAVREEVVTSLVAEVADAASPVPLEQIDLSGAVLGYADGLPSGPPAPSIAWRVGLDVVGVSRVCAGIEAIGYAAAPERVREDLAAYGDAAVSVIYRPAIPDSTSADNLRAKVDLARERSLGRVDFYHYGLMRLDALDLVREALSARPASAPV